MRRLAAVLFVLAAPAFAASPPAVEARNGMVVSSQHLASEAGLAILRAGGNAIDAAVAVGYAEAVTNPCCGNVGGGGFLVAHMADGRDQFINFRETAPAAATPGMYLDAAGKLVPRLSLDGWRASGVPGTVLGLDTALREYGTISRADAMAPAIRMARDGVVLTRGDTDILESKTDGFRGNPELARIFLRPDGTPWQPGDRLVQSDLARTLQAIADGGPDAFYRGATATAIARAAQAGGGLLTEADFAGYTVTESGPLQCSYRGYLFLSSPPPSSGGVTLCEILNILEGYDLKALGFHSAAGVHLMVEAMRRAYLDRNSWLGDPAFVVNPLARLLSKDYAAKIRETITDRAGVSDARDLLTVAPATEMPETTHYSVVDRAGNAVGVTYTINGSFGALAMAAGTGVLMNNEMDDFTTQAGTANLFGLVQGAANAVAPGKRPLSSMAPTIVMRDGRVFLVLGSPGGSRIITITLETAIDIVDHGMQPQEAVDAPRFHHQWLPDMVFAEPRAFSPDTIAVLRAMGMRVTEQIPWGAVELIAVGPPVSSGSDAASSGNDSTRTAGMRPGLLYGANDDRRPAGSAIGY